MKPTGLFKRNPRCALCGKPFVCHTAQVNHDWLRKCVNSDNWFKEKK